MKNVIALLALSTLVACGGGSSNTSGQSSNPVVDFPTLTADTMNAQQKRDLATRLFQNRQIRPGISKVTTRTGQDISQDTFETGKLKFEPLHKVETEVILRVDAGQTYTYKIEQDAIKNQRQIFVVLEADDRSQMEQEFVTSNVGLNGDVVTFSRQSIHEQISTIISGTISLSSPCNMNLRFGVKPFKMTTRSGQIDVPAFSQGISESCGREYSRLEMRVFDLRNATYCDETRGGNSTYCESRDMSYLTQGL